MTVTREMRRQLERDNAKLPLRLMPVPKAEWEGRAPAGVIEVWRSRGYLVQIYQENDGIVRLSICRSELNGSGLRWVDGISWEILQMLKGQCGRGDKCAVEVFPPDDDVVDVANMRHLWVLPVTPLFVWKK